MGCAPRSSPAFCAESISNTSLAESTSVPVLEGPRPGRVGVPSLPVPPGTEGVTKVSCIWWLWPIHRVCCFPGAVAEQANIFLCLGEASTSTWPHPGQLGIRDSHQPWQISRREREESKALTWKEEQWQMPPARSQNHRLAEVGREL